MVQRNGARTIRTAVNVLLDFEGLQLEQATNCRWGADDDPEVTALDAFTADRKGLDR